MKRRRNPAAKAVSPFALRPLIPVALLGLLLMNGAALAQTITKDYARYASMLNQERVSTARREQQNLYDDSARAARVGPGAGSAQSGGSSGARLTTITLACVLPHGGMLPASLLLFCAPPPGLLGLSCHSFF